MSIYDRYIGQVNKLAAALARIRELEAIIERLPKTADGVPVVPGMEVYDGESRPLIIYAVDSDGWLLFKDGGQWSTYFPEAYYSKPEAEAI